MDSPKAPVCDTSPGLVGEHSRASGRWSDSFSCVNIPWGGRWAPSSCTLNKSHAIFQSQYKTCTFIQRPKRTREDQPTSHHWEPDALCTVLPYKTQWNFINPATKKQDSIPVTSRSVFPLSPCFAGNLFQPLHDLTVDFLSYSQDRKKCSHVQSKHLR